MTAPRSSPGGAGAPRGSYPRRRVRYFVLMGICLVLFVSAWGFVRFWSVPAAIAMCVVAMVIPPAAVIVGNRRDAEDRWWDEGGP
ncbi:DUF3099 domain-containing protein [Streptomyces sp. JJ36]|uniref:DUF3099 domain-containing protein n=1 Tax=Streptomyces sp. JJ36 TaxID=2736645 RepID=UPI001F1B829D|nr:DUF3099 domain-containing protein [Streptomyces sp. JJ36]MCF6522690.1 DUF3099 domain-containing protein [Streptomyces sp. JJ36]